MARNSLTDIQFYKYLRNVLKTPSIRYQIPTSTPATAFQQKLHNQFLLSSRNLYQQSLAGSTERYARVRDYELMDTCVKGDTKIATLYGFETIEELSKKYSNGEKFLVYSYDHEKQTIIPAWAHNARQTRVDKTYKVTFDDGSFIIATANHPFMLRDGSYKRVDELVSGDSCMPFYRKKFYKNNPYNFIYTANHDISINGWIPEHRYVAECLNHTKIQHDECVHHKDFNPENNNPDNLVIMKKSEHKKYHCEITNQRTWSDENIRNSRIEKISKAANERWSNEENRKAWSEARMGDKNPFFGKKHTEEFKIKMGKRMSEFLTGKHLSDEHKNNISKSGKGIKHTLSEKGKIGFLLGIKKSGRKLSEVKELELQELQQKLNHKVKSVEYYGVEDVYDLTVDKYENFATDTIFIHNSSPLCSMALNVYADNATQIGSQGRVLTIRCSDEKIKEELERLYYDILMIEFNAWHWNRNVSKYGDMFVLLDVSRGEGITSYLTLPTVEIEREEGYDGNVNSTRFKWTYNAGMTYDNFQIAHFKLTGDDTFLPYGRAILEPARRPWKQFNLIFDAMLSYRIARAPERRVFYVDVGNLDNNSIDEYMMAVRDKFKRQPLVDNTAGNIDYRYNAVPLDDDYFIPVRGESKTRIDTLPGAQNLGDIEDVRLVRSELINALGIPSVYVDDNELGAGRTVGAQQDLQFARSIQRLQKCFLSELMKVGFIHLAAKGYNVIDLPKFILSMTPPSAIMEMQKLEVFDKRFTIFSNAIRDKGISRRYAQKYILELTDEEIERIEKELKNDSRLVAELQTIESGNMNAQTAVGAGPEAGMPTTGSDAVRNPLTPEAPMTDSSVNTDLGIEKKDNSIMKKRHDYLSKIFSESYKYDREIKQIVKKLNENLKSSSGS
jgi:hypothetical protein